MATFPGWHEETDERGSIQDVRAFPSRALSYLGCGMLAMAVLCIMISSLWQHTASVASSTTAQNFAYGFVKSEVGAAAMGIGWALLGAYLIVLLLLGTVTLSIRRLNRLTLLTE